MEKVVKKLLIYFFFFLLATFSLLSSGVIDSQDGFQYLAVARNIYYKGKPTAPVYEYNRRENVHLSTYLGKDGNTYSPTGLGFSLAMLPAVAVTDLVYKIYNISPPVHFPLENDWLILLTASFTNGFFAAVLGVTIFLYLLELGLSKKQALLISFAGLFTTNLLPYAKYSFPHMMFTAFLVLAFFLIKKYFQTKKKLFLIFAGASFGMVSITYNQTFILSAIPLGLYFLLLSKPKFSLSSVTDFLTGFRKNHLLKNLLIFTLGFLPLLVVYFWFENLRAGGTENLANPFVLASRTAIPLQRLPKIIFFEGLYGQLFSSGRSIFIYSPIFLLIILFWNKIKKIALNETLVFIAISAIYVLFYATQYSVGGPDQGIAGLWHGESSWGPRYLIPLLPFGVLIIGSIFKNLSRYQKLFIFLPLLILGFYINMLGVVMPYQIKYHDLQPNFFVNATEFTTHTYSNFIPRFSPIIQMSKKLRALPQSIPQTIDHGKYNAKFYDGIDFSFPVGPERWRVIEGTGYISFDNFKKDTVKKLTFGLINHPITESGSQAIVNISLNGQSLSDQPLTLEAKERNIFVLPVKQSLLKDKDNKLVINVNYKDQTVIKNHKQILGLIAFSINDTPINLESLDFPYVSSLGTAMGYKYNTYGESITDPWRFWELHTQVYERTPDFWWFKYLIYWDIPKLPLLILLATLILSLIYSGNKTLKILFALKS